MSFLPSFALRRKSVSNVLGGTRLTGFLYTDTSVFIPYYIDQTSDGIYADVERRTFTSQGFLCGRTPTVLYTTHGEQADLLETVYKKKNRKSKSTTDTFPAAIEKFGCPVALVPLTPDGMRQLRILCVQNHRNQLIKRLLGKDYLPPEDKQSDGRHKTTNENYLIGFDCNITRFQKAMQNDRALHIFLLPHQVTTVQKYLLGQNAVLHSVEPELAESILGIPHELPSPEASPFQTEKGNYLYATPFR